MSDAPDSVLERIQKLFNLANHNPNENEAAEALKKANALLEEHNLTAESLNEIEVGSGARKREALEGGFHQWQRDLWKAVAELNFCWYWNDRVYNWKKEKDKYGEVRIWKHKNFIVGRKVNIAATVAMATYLGEVATRLAREKTQGENPKHTLGNWANSYRHGIVASICQNLSLRRNEALRSELEARERAARAADGVTSLSNAISLNVLVDKEMDANYDFEFGEGWSAKRAAERALDARIRRMSKDEYTQWAVDNPDEAMRREVQSKARRRSSGGSGSSSSNIDNYAYWAGREDGKKVSIDEQVGGAGKDRRVGHTAGRIGHGQA